jgi:hypothetical protein
MRRLHLTRGLPAVALALACLPATAHSQEFLGKNLTRHAAEPPVPKLMKIIEDRKETVEVRQQAATELRRGGFSPDLEKAMPRLLRVVADPTEENRVRERLLWAVNIYLSKSQEREVALKTLTGILAEPPRKDNKLFQYNSVCLLAKYRKGKVPNKALDILLEYLKDATIKIYQVGKPKPVADGRIAAVDALSAIGAERVARRPDIVQQLRILQFHPDTMPNLRDALKKFMPRLEEQLKKK